MSDKFAESIESKRQSLNRKLRQLQHESEQVRKALNINAAEHDLLTRKIQHLKGEAKSVQDSLNKHQHLEKDMIEQQLMELNTMKKDADGRRKSVDENIA